MTAKIPLSKLIVMQKDIEFHMKHHGIPQPDHPYELHSEGIVALGLALHLLSLLGQSRFSLYPGANSTLICNKFEPFFTSLNKLGQVQTILYHFE